MARAETEAQVFLVDDDPALRAALGRWLECPEWTVHTFASGQEFLDVARPQPPACVLLDLCMPGKGGLEVYDELVRRGAGVPVMLMSAYGTVALAVQALKRGVWDFLEKPVDGSTLLERVRAALAETAEERRARVARAQLAVRLPSLTPRERELMRRLVSGEAGKAIAAACGISPRTVDVHRARILRKLGASSLVQLALAMAQAWSDQGGGSGWL